MGGKSLGGDEFKTEGGGGVVEAGEFLALHFFLRLPKPFRVEDFPVFEEMPQDARQWDSLAPPRSALRAFSLQSNSFRGFPKPLKCAPGP